MTVGDRPGAPGPATAVIHNSNPRERSVFMEILVWCSVCQLVQTVRDVQQCAAIMVRGFPDAAFYIVHWRAVFAHLCVNAVIFGVDLRILDEPPLLLES